MAAHHGQETAISLPGAIGSGEGSGRVLATLTGLLFLTFLDTTIMSVTLQDMQLTLHVAVSSLQWVVNGYALVFASLMLAFGTLGDRLGRKRVMSGWRSCVYRWIGVWSPRP